MQQKTGAYPRSALAMVLCAVLMGINYELFIFPNAFAPAGLNGLATMAQYLFHFSFSYFSVLINLPLLLLAWRKVDRVFARRTLIFVLSFSVTTLLLNRLDFSAVAFHTENGSSAILGPVAAGVINGAIYTLVLRNNGSTGGTDILAALIRARHPEVSLVWIIFALNAVVAAISYFVYGCKFEPVILCLIYCYLSSRISNDLMKMGDKALKFEIITDDAEALGHALMEELHHGVTLLHAEGMYSNREKNMLICVVNRHQVVDFHNILARFPGSFAYVSDVNETMGNFHRARKDK